MSMKLRNKSVNISVQARKTIGLQNRCSFFSVVVISGIFSAVAIVSLSRAFVRALNESSFVLNFVLNYF